MIDLTGTSLNGGSEIAFRWGFTCANDVIEGAYSVAEPSSLALFGLGLLGLGIAVRRRNS